MSDHHASTHAAEAVAIIGAGPGGLVAARYLKGMGFKPVLFEKGERLGGQWTGDPAYSGVWPTMRTNTSRVMTRFSDLAYPPGTPVYPTNQSVHAYLHHYAEAFGLLECLRLRTRVDEIDRAPAGGWTLRYTGPEDQQREETFQKVVVAPGRYSKPSIPDVPGLDSFSGFGGVHHAFRYRGAEPFRGQRVLVAGCSISALEIASELAMQGADRVVSTNRRQRYVLNKLLAGVPTEHLAFTRFSALAEAALPFEAVAQGMKEFVLRSCGSPEQYGAPKPSDNVFEAGITQCQHFLPLVAEGRITPKPWMTSVEGQTVRFSDGTEEEFDAIVFGTGYRLNLPFLSEGLQRTLDVDDHHLDLHAFTFHPDLPGLAFLGLYEMVGPYFPVLELQARWIAYAWGGAQPAPEHEAMEAGVAAYQSRRGGPQALPMHVFATLFGREAGVEPELDRWPELARALLFGPLTPVSFRLSGPDRLPEAAERTAEEAAAFGAVPSPELTPEQCAQLRALAGARGDYGFAQFVDRLTAPQPAPEVLLQHDAEPVAV